MRNSRARALDIFGEGEDSGHRMENTIEWGGSKTGLARRTTEGSGQIEVLEQRAVGSEKIPHQIGGANIDTPPHRNYSPVIGITGWMGSGKTEAANWICQAYDWEALKMAAPIKTMLSSVGLSKAHLEGDLKEIETPIILSISCWIQTMVTLQM